MSLAEIDQYRAALAAAREAFQKSTHRLRSIREEKTELEADIVRLRRTITALSAMCSEAPALDHLGITDGVMSVMNAAPSIMTSADVVKALTEEGFDFSNHKNAVASVHAILARLSQAQKIERILDDGRIAWRGPNFQETSDGDIRLGSSAELLPAR